MNFFDWFTTEGDRSVNRNVHLGVGTERGATAVRNPSGEGWTFSNFDFTHPWYLGWPSSTEIEPWDVEDLADMVNTMKAFEVLANA